MYVTGLSAAHQNRLVAAGEFIYRNIRTLSGVIGSYSRPHSTVYQIPDGRDSLGFWADYYIESHGFTHEAIKGIYDAFENAADPEDFANRLAGGGMAIDEANFLCALIQKCE
jgi:hypothetical protein